MIKEDGVDWVYQEVNRAETDHVKVKMIQNEIELHQR